jgi:cob(I)alamin adenosyltransferase
MVRAERLPEPLDAVLNQVQSDLFLLDAEFVGATHARREVSPLADKNVRQLEAHIDRFDAGLPRLRNFVLPGGARAGAFLHLARAVCRRAERRLVTLLCQDPATARPVALAYLNRLSDLLFVLARAANAESGIDEPTWPQRRPTGPG